MGQVEYRANLDSQHFPFLSRYQGRTIIVPKQDQAFDNNIVAQANNPDRDKGIPQVFYCHNVMPTANGYQSIGFKNRIAPVVGEINFQSMFTLRDLDENKFLYSPVSVKHYVFDATLHNAWTASSTQSISSSSLVTVAYLAGHSYIFFKGVGMFEYNNGTGALDAVVLTGVTAANLNGVCSANGFLLLWDEFNVYRSQATDPLNFTPDPTLGSGSSTPDDIDGQIVVCLPINNGFVIYTTKNAVGASFSQNIRYPFIYKEVVGSSGILSPEHVTWQDNSGFHYAWTISGLQKVDKSNAVLVFPEASDFLAQKVLEDFDSTTNTFTERNTLGNFIVKLTTVGRRFFCISYGLNDLTYCLIYDLQYKRWGKIKQNHVDVFDYYIPNIHGNLHWNTPGLTTTGWEDLGNTAWEDLSSGIQTFERPLETLAFLQKDGTVTTLEFDLVHDGDDGVLITGKYQFLRSNFLIIDEIRCENVDPDDIFSVTVLPTIDGKNFINPVSATLTNDLGLNREFMCSIEARNHTLVFNGTFNISCLELTFHVGGHS